MTRIAIFVGSQGRGSNMASIVAASQASNIPAEAALVIGSKEGTPSLLRAEALGVRTVVVKPKEDGYASKLLTILEENEIDLICLAGFMWLLPAEVVEKYRSRILNIHPALLPKFGGKGMYGMHVHEAVIAAGEKESGCSVHFVTEEYDEGAVILQKKCDVSPDDTPETLAHKVLDLEHTAYVEAINKLLSE